MRGIIFYFSGTGNSFAVSKELLNNLEGFQCANLLDAVHYDIRGYDVVGFVFPVYYIHAPTIVLQVIEGINFIRSQSVFCVATYGASFGYALSDIRNVLKKSDVFIQEFRVKMPGNYLLEYGAFPVKMQQVRIRQSQKTARKIAKAVQAGKQTEEIGPNHIARIFKHSGDGKDAVFRKLGKQFYTSEKCTSCKLCESICPVSNISVQDDSGVVWFDKCQQCMACVQWCPQNAIFHPLRKTGRNRYTHPEISQKELWG